ncbi:MAG: DinB family protein [Candidatus Solibacter sp.]|nr:DinB family protein [Candidatus Solibacter sp.]
MNGQDELLARLKAGRDEFLTAVEGVTEEQAAAKPVAGWSILECAGHVAIVEEYLRRQLMERAAPTESEMSREREAFLSAAAANRGRKIAAPDVARPSGRFATLSEAVECFCRNREQTIAYIASCQEDLRRLTMDHPMIGAVSGQEALILMMAHPFRHARQIQEGRER